MDLNKSKFKFPCVTMDDIMAFDTNDHGTYTQSILVNAVLDAFLHVRPLNSKNLGRYLDLSPRDVSYGLHAATGLSLQEVMDEWRTRKFHQLLQQEPGISGKEMAERLAFSSQGALWKFLTSKKLITPLTRQGWRYGNYKWLLREAEKTKKADVKAEHNRRKWEYLTIKNN